MEIQMQGNNEVFLAFKTSEEETMEDLEKRFMELPFTKLGIGAIRNLSNRLDVMQVYACDWRMVAEKCGYDIHQIQNILYMSKRGGTCAMHMFEELANTRDPQLTIGQLYTILVDMQRRDATQIISDCFEDFVKAETDSSQPLDLTTVKKIPLLSAQAKHSTEKQYPKDYSFNESSSTHTSQNAGHYFVQANGASNRGGPQNAAHTISHQFAQSLAVMQPPATTYGTEMYTDPREVITVRTDNRISGASRCDTDTITKTYPPPSEQQHPYSTISNIPHNQDLRIEPTYEKNYGQPAFSNNVPLKPDYKDYDNNLAIHSQQHVHRDVSFHAAKSSKDRPPPLMPIEQIGLGPPPPYTEHAPETHVVPHRDWRESDSVRSPSVNSDVTVMSSNYARSPSPKPPPSGYDKAPVEHSMQSSSTEGSDSVTSLKRRMAKVDVGGGSSESIPKRLSSPAIEEKGSKEISHQYVIDKLRRTLTKNDKQKQSSSSKDTIMNVDGSGSAVHAVLPTVVESNYNERAPRENKIDDDEAKRLFMSKPKSNTYPRKIKESKSIDMSPLRSSLSATPVMDSVPFNKETKIKVFLTYGKGLDGDENWRIINEVAHLEKVLKDNKFQPIRCSEGASQDTHADFTQADFVLVCISQSYKVVVKSKELQRHGTSHSAARTCYKWMQKEFKANDHQNRRFIPVLLPGVDISDAPDWFKNICPTETFYRLDRHMRNLLYHLAKPEKVMEKFLQKQSLYSLPTKPVTKKELNAFQSI